MTSEGKVGSLYTDLTGWSLGEKKAIKDAQTKYFAPNADKLKKLGFVFDFDMPKLLKSTGGEEHYEKKQMRERVAEAYEKWVPEFVGTIEEFCKNADYKEALTGAVKNIVFSFNDDARDTGKYEDKYGAFEIKDKTLWARYGGYYTYCSSFDKETLTKYLEGAL